MSAPTDLRMERPHAITIARAFVALLEGTYADLKVAGSLRRRLAYVHDVEVVAVPKVEHIVGGLFGDEGIDVDCLNARMDALLDSHQVTMRLDRNGVPRWGPRLKYLTFRDARIDLFSPSAEQLGWHLLLRTGPAAFSRQLVVERGRKTKDGRPGLLPPIIVPRDGWLTWRTSGERIPTPTEAEACRVLGVPYFEPWERM